MSSMNKIEEGIFLGNIKAASDKRILQNNVSTFPPNAFQGITHILQVASNIKPFFPNVSFANN